MKRWVYGTALVLLLSCNAPKADLLEALPKDSLKVHADHDAEVWLTVFIHGIMSIKSHLNLKTVVKLFKDQVEDTLYADAIDHMRDNPFFYKNQAMQDRGLCPIDCTKKEAGYASGALAYLFDSISQKLSSTPVTNYFYTFGWSGIISHRARKRAAQRLYKELTAELDTLKAAGIKPKVRIVGYSHGGNVALNLGAVPSEKDVHDHPFTVDELILLGTPIQCENDQLITSQLFQRVYNIFSPADRIQCLDCFSRKRFFSKQLFKERKDFSLPDKLVQVQVRATSSTHKAHLDTTHPAVVSGHARFLRNRSPGHAELWFFGWTPQNYRKNYPLYPLPTVAVIPFILEGIKQQMQNYNPADVIIADLRPEYSHMIVRTEHKYTSYAVTSFLSNDQIKEFTQQLALYTPKAYTKTDYDKQIYAALQVAQQERSKEKKEKSKKPAA